MRSPNLHRQFAGMCAPLFTALLIALGTCGCTPQPPPAPASSSAPSPTSPSAPPVNQSPVRSNGADYVVSTTEVTAATPDHTGSWHLIVGQLSGGDPRVADVFNKSAIASANSQLDQVRSEAGTVPWTLEAKATVTARAITISQLLIGVYYARAAAHPINYPSTVVIDSRTAHPITLHDVFADEQLGLARLSEQTRAALHIQTANAADPDVAGTAPDEKNFANWIPTTQGIEIHFADGQIGPGLPVVTVSWTSITDLLAPDMAGLTTA